jgi:hypothetical protein
MLTIKLWLSKQLESKLATLSALKLVAAKRSNHIAPVQQRRNKMGKRLWEQIQLAKSQQDGSKFAVQRVRTVTDSVTGERKQVESAKRLKPWWFTADNGKTAIAVRYGARVLELAKGKFAVELASSADLVATLELIKTAVEAGELDTQLEATAGNLRSGFKK